MRARPALLPPPRTIEAGSAGSQSRVIASAGCHGLDTPAGVCAFASPSDQPPPSAV